MTSTKSNEPASKRPRRMAREPKPQEPSGLAEEQIASSGTAAPSPPSPQDKPPTKTAAILDLLIRPEGATLAQMVKATGWLPHTTRAALTGLKKKGQEVTSLKADGIRTYRVIDTSFATTAGEDEG